MPSSLDYLREEVETRSPHRNKSDGRLMNIDKLFASLKST